MMTSVAQICGHFGCSDKATIVQGKKKDVPEEGGGCSGRDISFLFFLDFFHNFSGFLPEIFACSDRHNNAEEERCAEI